LENDQIKELKLQEGVKLSFCEAGTGDVRQDARHVLSSVEWVRSLIHHGHHSGPSLYILSHALLVGIEFCLMCGEIESARTLESEYICL